MSRLYSRLEMVVSVIAAMLVGYLLGVATALALREPRCVLCAHRAQPMDFVRRVEAPTARPTPNNISDQRELLHGN